MLMMQIQLRSMLFVAVIVWTEHTHTQKKIEKTFIQYLKMITQISKVVHVIDRRDEHSDMCFGCFSFTLLININKNINQHAYWNYI